MWASSSGLRCKLHPDFAVQRLVSFQTLQLHAEDADQSAGTQERLPLGGDVS